MASQSSAYLPPGEGLLPKWLLFVSIVSLGNSIQSYFSLKGTREVYAGKALTSSTTQPSADIPARTIVIPSPVNELSARTFGTWTALSSIIRLYAAYHINDKAVYEMCLWTFGIAWAHFLSEWLIFGTARWSRGLAGPVIVATGSGIWMISQWGWYVR